MHGPKRRDMVIRSCLTKNSDDHAWDGHGPEASRARRFSVGYEPSPRDPDHGAPRRPTYCPRLKKDATGKHTTSARFSRSTRSYLVRRAFRYSSQAPVDISSEVRIAAREELSTRLAVSLQRRQSPHSVVIISSRQRIPGTPAKGTRNAGPHCRKFLRHCSKQ